MVGPRARGPADRTAPRASLHRTVRPRLGTVAGVVLAGARFLPASLRASLPPVPPTP